MKEQEYLDEGSDRLIEDLGKVTEEELQEFLEEEEDNG